MQTEEQFYVTDRATLLRWLPWLHLLRAFRISLGAQKLLLGGTAAMFLVAGQQAIDRLPFAPEEVRESPSVAWPWDEPRLDLEHGLDEPGAVLRDGAAHATVLLRPLQNIIEPGRALLQLGSSWSDVAWAWTHLLWALVVWALFGVALCRMAVLDFSHKQTAGARESLRFSMQYLQSAVGAPLIPLGFVGVLWLICCLGGLGARLPFVGEILAGLLWFIPLLLGLAAAVIIGCIAVGWPLMMCTISVERSDAFDGLSRAYDYLVSRPWYAIWLAVLSLVTGAAALLVVGFVVQLGSHFGTWAMGSGMGDAAAVGISGGGPESLTSRLETPDQVASETSSAGRVMVTMWMQALALLEWGFVYSFFWTSVTLIYLLLRRSVDATPLEAVSLLEEPTADELPLGGTAAAEQREADARAAESEPEASTED